MIGWIWQYGKKANKLGDGKSFDNYDFANRRKITIRPAMKKRFYSRELWNIIKKEKIFFVVSKRNTQIPNGATLQKHGTAKD